MRIERSRVISFVRTLASTCVAACALSFSGCGGSGDLPLDQVDPTAVPANPTYDEVYAILHRECASCHSDGDNLDVENCIDIVAERTSIVERVEDNTMPPGAWPRLTSEEKLLIRRWVDNGTPAPCN